MKQEEPFTDCPVMPAYDTETREDITVKEKLNNSKMPRQVVSGHTATNNRESKARSK